MLGKPMQAKGCPSTTRIQCPKLQRLEMVCSSQDHVLQSSLQSLTSIRSLRLEDTVTGLLYLRSIVLPSLQCIAIHTTYGATVFSSDRDGVLVLNTLLQNTLLPPKVSLRIGYEIALDTLNDIRWDVVTDLTIASFVDSRIMLKLLRCMPSLARYQVNVEIPDEKMYLDILDEQAIQSQPDIQHVLSTSLTHLRTYTRMLHTSEWHKLEFALAKYLMAGLPSLLQMSWPNIKFDQLFAFARQSQHEYPHLRKLKIVL
ncbi:hypothetical protein GGI23_003867 [Coemansia sp. RSA 2559]|nr:hypothetical protein GGI23_003867 [Coemansia sp. RSA 2559]KAJ2854038.1 hypothetical protein GGI22_004637 [Coemansia erecta]